MNINEGVIFMSDGAKIVIAGIMAYTIYRVAGKCSNEESTGSLYYYYGYEA